MLWVCWHVLLYTIQVQLFCTLLFTLSTTNEVTSKEDNRKTRKKKKARRSLCGTSSTLLQYQHFWQCLETMMNTPQCPTAIFIRTIKTHKLKFSIMSILYVFCCNFIFWFVHVVLSGQFILLLLCNYLLFT